MVDELITLDGFPLTGLTREGVWKRLGELEGWFDSPEPKRDRASRVNGDGNIWTEINYEARLLTFSGRVVSRNHGYLHEAAMRLAALPGRGNKKFVVEGHGPTQWAMVDPRGKVSTSFPTDTRLEFQIPMESVDPLKYGKSRSFQVPLGEAVYVHQRGFEDAWPIITVTGTAPGGYAVSLGGRLVRVTAPLTAGNTHTLDMRTGILRVSGTRVHGAISVAEYWAIKPGLPQVANTAPVTTGSGTVRFDFHDTYI